MATSCKDIGGWKSWQHLARQTPAGATTVPNPFGIQLPSLKEGIVTGAFDKPLTFSEDMDDDVVLNVHITTNQSFED